MRPEPGPDTGILVTIRSLLPNLAPVERRVAQAVLDDPQGVAWRSISELARACGTSATSVVRFCRAIGLRGYPDLRLALAGAVARDDVTAVAVASHDIDPGDEPGIGKHPRPARGWHCPRSRARVPAPPAARPPRPRSHG